MASPVASSVILLCVFAASSASAATFTITNNCSFTIWPAAIPIGGGLQLNPGQTWTLDVPLGTNAGRIWHSGRSVRDPRAKTWAVGGGTPTSVGGQGPGGAHGGGT
nr:unnamed protein product [Digitaria exilis]